MPQLPVGGPGGFEKLHRRQPISPAQAYALADRATLAKTIGMEDGFWQGEASSRFGTTPPNVSLLGGTPGIFVARNLELAEGRAFVEADLRSARDICVLGGGLATNLFPHSSPVGEKIKFAGIGYTVIGVLESKGAAGQADQDNFAVIPLTTGLNRFGRAWRSLRLIVEARDAESMDDAMEQVRGHLRTLRKVPPGEPDDFEISTSESLIAQFRDFTLKVRVGVALVSSIALLAAGVGIMNIMLVSVTERTKEIGIRRAVGAKKRNIMAQFVLEAIVLCEVGGLIGIGFGIAAGNVVAMLLKVPAIFPLQWSVLGLVVCSIVGIVFGTYPAYKAANLDPIESLRYE